MRRGPLEILSVVRSQAGRDAGRVFLITALPDDEYVEIVDGDLRTLERPKKKKRKHVKALPTADEAAREQVENLRRKVEAGEHLANHEIRRCLSAYKPEEG